MKFRHNETGQIFQNEDEFRRAYPNVSFPVPLDENALQFANVSNVIEVYEPVVLLTQRTQYDGVQFIDGQWTEVWSVHPKFDDPTEQEQWEIECLETLWGNIRGKRDSLLAATDYTDLPNTPITDECRTNFINYRQQLRDITKTQTDPNNIIWPAIPTHIPKN
jgi:hypothetical protein